MPFADIFSRLAASLFSSQATSPADDIEPALLDEAVDAIVEAVEPRIRLVPRYRGRLAPVAARTIRFMRSLAPALPAPIELSSAAWSVDPTINAFFATATDVTALLGRDDALQGFFANAANIGCDAAHCLLAMRREERRVLASAIVDGQLRSDVAQTTVGFAGHRLLAITGDALATRRLVGQAILERMASLALERIVATRERATDLDVRKSVLAARLRMLTLRRGSLRELAAGEQDPAIEIAAIERELKTTAQDHLEVKASIATLDYSIEQIEQVLGDPEQHVGLDTVAMRVNHMGYKLDAASAEPGTELKLNELWIGPNLRGVITPVHIPRAALPPRRDRLADAARRLG